jgi:glycosyltransferase involved in cell wall biosynthesis
MAAPRVSIITPAHDNAATIDGTIRSVAGQSIADWEHVICDDASSDDTAARVEAAAAADPRVRLVRLASNGGPSAARNAALEVARGELVAFLDADDRYEPDYLRAMTAAFDAAPDGVGIVCCDAWREDADGGRLGRYSGATGGAAGADLLSVLRGNPIFIASLCPRAVVEEVGRFSTECWGSEDHDLWLRIIETGRSVVYVDEPLVVYRVQPGSVSSSRERMARTDQATFRRALARGRLGPRERRVATARLHLAIAAEAAARGPRISDVPAFARAALARLTLRRSG